MVARKLAVRLYWMLKQQQPYRPAHALSSPRHSVSAPLRQLERLNGRSASRLVGEFEP